MGLALGSLLLRALARQRRSRGEKLGGACRVGPGDFNNFLKNFWISLHYAVSFLLGHPEGEASTGVPVCLSVVVGNIVRVGRSVGRSVGCSKDDY